MDMRKRRDAQLAYISDESVFEEQVVCRRILQKLNFMDRADFDGIAEVVKELLGKSDNAFINPPFYCDYGKNIETGKNFFANYNCTILDVAKVRIGDNCQFAPNVAIYTAGHPVHPDTRNTLYEYGKEVTVGDNVWLGGKYGGMPRGPYWKQRSDRCGKCCDKRHSRLVCCGRESLPGDPEDHRGGQKKTVSE